VTRDTPPVFRLYNDVQADRFVEECAAADGQHSFGVFRRDVQLGRERISGKVR